MLLQYAVPVVSEIRSGMICAFPAIAATPTPLLLVPPAVPATQVPCPLTSAVFELLSLKFQPDTICADRSGCEPSTPVSRIAIVTPAPSVESQAAGAPTMAAWY